MDDSQIFLRPIGYIESPFDEKVWIPRQGNFNKETGGVVVLNPAYEEGLLTLDSFRYCWILFYFHKSAGFDLLQVPPKDDKLHGVFSIRSPRRPNRIGMTAVKIEKIEGNRLYFTGADMINGTPVLDIKPYVEDADCIRGAGRGWLD